MIQNNHSTERAKQEQLKNHRANVRTLNNQAPKRAEAQSANPEKAAMLARIKKLLPGLNTKKYYINHPNSTLEAALSLGNIPLSIIPVKTDGSKAPAIEWKPYQEEYATFDEKLEWFDRENPPAIGIVHGILSLGSEVIDVDEPSLVETFEKRLEEVAPGLLSKLLIVRTPRDGGDGGRHYYYTFDPSDFLRYGGESGNQKLAEREICLEDISEEEAKNAGARLKDDGKWYVVKTLIETRGEGGYTIAPGSPAKTHQTGKPYTLIQGEFTLKGVEAIRLTFDERATLLEVAYSFNEYVNPKKVISIPRTAKREDGVILPGEAFDQSPEAFSKTLATLESHGWKHHSNDKLGALMTRPGKYTGVSARLFDNGYFYVFSTNAHPFESEQTYSPFAVLTELEHNGDYSAAARALSADGYGERRVGQGSKAAVQGNQSKTEPPKDEFNSLPVKWLADVKEEKVDWLMPGVPLGEVTIIDGDPKAGKSWITFSWAAAVSNGNYPQLPGWTEREPGKVLIFSLENKSTKVIKPRLRHLNANMENIAVIDVPVVLDRDSILSIEEAVAKVKPDLIIIDPIVAYIGGGLDMNQANKVREPMQRLQILAAKFKCAVVAVRHLNKGNGSKAMYRGQGSIDFIASVRSSFIAITNPENKNERALHHIASNLGKEIEPIGYTIENTDDDVGVLLWTGAPKFNLENALTHQTLSQEEVDDQNDVISFLSAMLEKGEQASNDIKVAAKEEGFTDKQLRTARRTLGVMIRYVGQGRNQRTYWRKPETEPGSEQEQDSGESIPFLRPEAA